MRDVGKVVQYYRQLAWKRVKKRFKR